MADDAREPTPGRQPGRRVYAEPGRPNYPVPFTVRGDYGRDDTTGVWYCHPHWAHGAVALTGHKVTEHADGTVSVAGLITASVRTRGMVMTWRGHLTAGVWDEAGVWEERGAAAGPREED